MTSPAFEPGGWIPQCHNGYGRDADHPLIPGCNHWVAWNLPPVSVIPQNLPKGAAVEQPFHIEQGLGYGKHCYRGPKPPFNWYHDYHFTVYTLDSALNINANLNKKTVLQAMEGHILQTGVLIGKYQLITEEVYE